MRYIKVSLIVLFFSFLFTEKAFAEESKKSPVDYVSTLVGTQSKHSLSAGNTYPAVALPWGMNFWSPQTGKMGDGWMYTYDSDKIKGIKQTHQPSPWINDYGQFAIMPVTGTPVFDENKRASWFSHKAEIAKPYYYKVYLADHDTSVEVTPTERAAVFRFTFPVGESYVVLDAFDKGSEVRIVPSENKIIGYTSKNSGGVPDNFKNYFEIVFDKPFTFYATVLDNGEIVENRDRVEGNHAGGIVGFRTSKGEVVNAKVASSFISSEQASINIKELGDGDFDRIKEDGRKLWNNVLGVFEVEDSDIDRLRTFYSCLYRSVLFPRSFYEVNKDGEIFHYSPYNGKILPGYMFTDTGFWDTFRALFPLLNLAYPSMNEKMQQGLANAYRESGFLPEWASPGHRSCMVGNNSASVVADAWLKGVKVPQNDIDTLWDAVVSGTMKVHPQKHSTGRYGHEYYNELGYVPYDVGINENAARTLEYAYDDWCIYKLGKDLGKSEKDLAPFKKRALNYRNLFDPGSKLMRGKNRNGEFQKPFNPLKWGDAFTEGNSWHYTWSVFHDPKGLIDLMGGKGEFVAMMDSVFNLPPVFDESYYNSVIHEIREMQIMNMGNYAHGNQPIQHFIYLYDWAGEPWKAQKRVREVQDKFYTADPDGYCGDEDNGQTSAWYVFSSLGFYPVCPGSGEYAIGTPLFKRVRINLENGQKVEIIAPDNSRENMYIDKMTVNGNNHDLNYINHDVLTGGARIMFEMSPRPNKSRGISSSSAPYSFSNEK